MEYQNLAEGNNIQGETFSVPAIVPTSLAEALVQNQGTFLGFG